MVSKPKHCFCFSRTIAHFEPRIESSLLHMAAVDIVTQWTRVWARPARAHTYLCDNTFVRSAKYYIIYMYVRARICKSCTEHRRWASKILLFPFPYMNIECGSNEIDAVCYCLLFVSALSSSNSSGSLSISIHCCDELQFEWDNALFSVWALQSHSLVSNLLVHIFSSLIFRIL